MGDILSVYILIDRSGSMQGEKWTELNSAINAYVKELSPHCLSVVVFHKILDDFSYDVVYNGFVEEPTKFNLSFDEFPPSGMTPLLDAMGRICWYIEQKEKDTKKLILITITDGHENSSRHFTKDDVKRFMTKFENRKWETVFLGASFNEIGEQAKSFGVNVDAKSLAMQQGQYNVRLVNLASSTRSYVNKGEAIDFGKAN